MAGRGKRKRTDADEAENSLGPGLEQPLECGKEKDKKYHKKVKFVSKIRETFCEDPKIINEFKIFLGKLKKSIEESSKFELKVDKAICGEPKITKKFEAKYKKRIENSSKNDGIDELLDEDTFHTLFDLEMWITYLAERGTPSEPSNAAAGSSGSPHNEECKFSTLQKLVELVMEFHEKHRMTEEFKAFCEKYEEKVEEQGKLCEALGEASEALREGGANKHSDEELRMILNNFYPPKSPGPTLGENFGSDMLQTVGIEGVLMTGGVTNSSSARGHGGPILDSPSERAKLKRRGEEELHEARRDKRPATADTPPRPPICGSQPSGFMADARRQTSSESAIAHIFSTNKGIVTGGAVHDKEVSSHAEVEKRKFTNEPRTESNDFANLLLASSRSHVIYLEQQYEKFQAKDAERRKQEQEVLAAASIDANPKFKEMKKEIDDLKKQVEKLQGELAKRDEPSGTTPPGDPNVASLPANSPPLQTVNAGTSNADQEDNTANGENKAAEANNLEWAQFPLPDFDTSEWNAFCVENGLECFLLP